jgi:FAD/FMN-containing dehydrogenase
MTFRASAGATWRDVIATLDKAGFSPPVMQSNNDFRCRE